MGIGFCVICNKKHKNEVLDIIKNNKLEGYEIGEVTSKAGVVEIGDNLTL